MTRRDLGTFTTSCPFGDMTRAARPKLRARLEEKKGRGSATIRDAAGNTMVRTAAGR